MAKYRYVGTHADEVHVGDKRVMLGPGDFVDMSAKDLEAEANQHLQLLEVSGSAKKAGDTT